MIRMNIANEETGITISLKSKQSLNSEELQSIYNIVNKTKPKEGQVTINMPPRDLERYFDKFPTTVPLKDEVKPRPRAIELLNTERTLSTPIGDILQQRSVFNRVKVYINCPNCGNEQDGSTYEHNSYTKCPECETKLFNSYATDASLEPNEDGYVYMATSVIKPKRRYDDVEEAGAE